MSVEYNQNLLASISSNNSNVNSAVSQVQQYTAMCVAGQISKEEYAELIKDIQRQVNIQQNMDELENMEKLNTAINSLVQIAGLV